MPSIYEGFTDLLHLPVGSGTPEDIARLDGAINAANKGPAPDVPIEVLDEVLPLYQEEESIGTKTSTAH